MPESKSLVDIFPKAKFSNDIYIYMETRLKQSFLMKHKTIYLL